MQEQMLSLATLAKGVVIEAVDTELQKALWNINDPNTKATQKRVVRLEITLIPDEQRAFLTMSSSVSSKLAGPEPIYSSAIVESIGNMIGATEITKDASPHLYAVD